MCDVLQDLPEDQRVALGFEDGTIKLRDAQTLITCCAKRIVVPLSDLQLMNAMGNKYTGFRAHPAGFVFDVADLVINTTHRCGNSFSANINDLLQGKALPHPLADIPA